jgi:hypothetical protein
MVDQMSFVCISFALIVLFTFLRCYGYLELIAWTILLVHLCCSLLSAPSADSLNDWGESLYVLMLFL